MLLKIIPMFFALMCAVSGNATESTLNYQKIFGANYDRAIRIENEIDIQLQSYARKYSEDNYLMKAIIFPELIRYNHLYDIIETASLLKIYTRYGSRYANFSVGEMQMKPTFALSIETELKKHKEENWVKQLRFDKVGILDNYKNRLARVARIDNRYWQIRYLIAMIKCIRKTHKNTLETLSTEDKVVFIAAAYNSGWNHPANFITEISKKRYFHLNSLNAERWYCYSDIAIYRYRQLKAQ